jgi:hypothetical protein
LSWPWELNQNNLWISTIPKTKSTHHKGDKDDEELAKDYEMKRLWPLSS